MNDQNSLSVLVVDDHSIVSSGIEMILETEYPSVLVESAMNGDIMEGHLARQVYDLVILDVNMPDTDTHNLVHKTLIKHPATRLLIFSMNPEDIYARRFLKLGVSGYLNKDAHKTELLKAVRTILDGKKYFSEKTMQLISDDMVKGKKTENVFDLLTAREFEIMKHLLKGSRVKEISEITSLHPSTIGTQKARIFEKLGISNIVELKELAQINNIF